MPITNQMSAMKRRLILPDGFADYAWEVEEKGFFWDGLVEVGDMRVRVCFYDPVRLAQDVHDDLEMRGLFVINRLLVVPRLTVGEMEAAVEAAPQEFFEEY